MRGMPHDAMRSASAAVACLLGCALLAACSAPEETGSTSSAGAAGQGAAAAAGGQGAGGGALGGTGGQGTAGAGGGVGASTPSIDFGYYNVDTARWGQLEAEVTSWTNLLYAGGNDAGFSETLPAERQANLAALVERAAAGGFEIMLDLELGGPLTEGDVLLAAAAHWDHVSYLILGDELDMPQADADGEIALLHQRIQNLGLDDSKPVGVTLTSAVTLSSDVVLAGWDFINIEAYTDPCSCGSCGAASASEEIAAVGDRVAQMKARIPATTELTIVMQGYDRNGAFVDIPVLAELNRATYFAMAKGDPRVKAIVIFSWARAGNTCGTGAGFGFGSRGHPELQAVHQEIWADLTGGS
jgi:hypothetical protein